MCSERESQLCGMCSVLLFIKLSHCQCGKDAIQQPLREALDRGEPHPQRLWDLMCISLYWPQEN